MIAFYVMGAGLGHITRTLSIIDTLSLSGNILLLTNSHFFHANYGDLYPHITSHYPDLTLAHPTQEQLTTPSQLRKWINQQLKQYEVSTLYIDVFPVGIKGELNGLSVDHPILEIHLIARLLYWDRYKPLITHAPKFNQTLLLETLSTDYQSYINQHSTTVSPFVISYTQRASLKASISINECCAIIHSGSDQEIELLVDYTRDRLQASGKNMTIVVISPNKPNSLDSHIQHIFSYPATELLKQAKIIVSAAGFNILQDVSSLQTEHWVLPFERRFDNQFARAAQYRKKQNLLHSNKPDSIIHQPTHA